MHDPDREPRYDASSEQALLRHLHGADLENRRNASYCLGDVKEPTLATLQALLAASGDSDEEVAQAAMHSVAQLGPRLPAGAVEALLEATRAPQSLVREAAIHGLGNLEIADAAARRRCVERLQELLDDAASRAVACENLGFFGAETRLAIPRMVAMLDGELAPEARTAILQTIGNAYLNERDCPAEVRARVAREQESLHPGVKSMAVWCVQVLGPPDPPSKEELLARYANLQKKAEDLQQRMHQAARAHSPSTSTLMMRWLMIVGGAILLFGGGWWLFGGWGILGAIALPVVAFFGYVVLEPVVVGKMQPLGVLSIAVDGEVVRFHSTLDDAKLPAALLAQLDRLMLRYALGERLSAPQTKLIAGVRARLASPNEVPRAEPGAAGAPLLTVGRNNLGLTYSFTSSIGGGENVGDKADVCLALIGYGLSRPDGGKLAQALQQYCDHVERKGRSRALRSSGKLLL
jgi:hypothetical protein